jgi:hypothetical protein
MRLGLADDCMTAEIDRCFCSDYASARQLFVRAGRDVNARMETYVVCCSKGRHLAFQRAGRVLRADRQVSA